MASIAVRKRFKVLADRELLHAWAVNVAGAFALFLFLVVSYPHKGPVLFFVMLLYGFAVAFLTCLGDFEKDILLYFFSRPVKRQEILRAKADSILLQQVSMFFLYTVLDLSHAIFRAHCLFVRIFYEEKVAERTMKALLKQGDSPVTWHWVAWVVSAMLMGSLLGTIFGTNILDNKTTSETRHFLLRLLFRIVAVTLASGLCVMAFKKTGNPTFSVSTIAALLTAMLTTMMCIRSKFVRMDVL